MPIKDFHIGTKSLQQRARLPKRNLPKKKTCISIHQGFCPSGASVKPIYYIYVYVHVCVCMGRCMGRCVSPKMQPLKKRRAECCFVLESSIVKFHCKDEFVFFVLRSPLLSSARAAERMGLRVEHVLVQADVVGRGED